MPIWRNILSSSSELISPFSGLDFSSENGHNVSPRCWYLPTNIYEVKTLKKDNIINIINMRRKLNRAILEGSCLQTFVLKLQHMSACLQTPLSPVFRNSFIPEGREDASLRYP
jgi:hypothetical protein